MAPRAAHQGAEHAGRRRRGSAIVTVGDRGVDAAKRLALCRLQHGEQPAELIGRACVGGIERHGRVLLRLGANEAGLDDCGMPAARGIVAGAQAQYGGDQQGARIGRAGQHRFQHGAGQAGRDVLRLLLHRGRAQQQVMHRRPAPAPGQRVDRQILLMPRQRGGEAGEVVGQPRPHREARRARPLVSTKPTKDRPDPSAWKRLGRRCRPIRHCPTNGSARPRCRPLASCHRPMNLSPIRGRSKRTTLHCLGRLTASIAGFPAPFGCYVVATTLPNARAAE